MKTVYQADDGTVFNSRSEAEAHEVTVEGVFQHTVKTIRNLSSIKKVIEEYGDKYVGFWELKGESPDAYAAGRVIGIYRGPLRAVIEEAAREKNFFSYGGGGDIKLISIKELK